MAAICTGLINCFCICIGPSIVSYDNGVNNKEFIMTKSLSIIEQPRRRQSLAGDRVHLLGRARTFVRGEMNA